MTSILRAYFFLNAAALQDRCFINYTDLSSSLLAAMEVEQIEQPIFYLRWLTLAQLTHEAQLFERYSIMTNAIASTEPLQTVNRDEE